MKNVYVHDGRKAHRMNLILIIALLSFVGAPSQASEDGGATSVFSAGIGARASALGGAFSSIADDVSSAVWNPAGLGRMSRAQLEFSQIEFGELGFREQYAAVGYPSWRWGTFALTTRFFGVGGIERRDDRNVLLDDDLSDRQMEIGFAYGRRVQPGVTVGATLKFRQQTLADMTDSGLGLDVGLQAEPLRWFPVSARLAPRWSVALVASNLIEPTLRLDEEAVADPGGWRFGTSWRHPFGLQRSVQFSFDVATRRTMDTRVHTGIEARLMPYLDLRLGADHGRLTAGIRTGYQGIHLDYGFLDSELEPMHQVALSWKIGTTTEERRLAAQARETQRMRRAMEKSFERRMAERANDLLRDARTLLREGDVIGALEMANSARTLGVDAQAADRFEASARLALALEHERQEHLAEALLELAKALRLDAESQRALEAEGRIRERLARQEKRSRDHRRRFDDAMGHLTAGRFAAALDGFEAVLRANPDDAEADRLRAVASRALAERLEGLFASARAWVDAGDWERADGVLMQLDAEGGDAARILALRDRIVVARKAEAEAALAQAETPVSTPPTAVAEEPESTLSASERAELESMLQRGIDAAENGRSDEALRYWSFVWSRDPSVGAVADLLEQEYLTRGMELFASGALEDAIAAWESAREIDPDDARTTGYLQRAYEKLDRFQKVQGAR